MAKNNPFDVVVETREAYDAAKAKWVQDIGERAREIGEMATTLDDIALIRIYENRVGDPKTIDLSAEAEQKKVGGANRISFRDAVYEVMEAAKIKVRDRTDNYARFTQRLLFIIDGGELDSYGEGRSREVDSDQLYDLIENRESLTAKPRKRS